MKLQLNGKTRAMARLFIYAAISLVLSAISTFAGDTKTQSLDKVKISSEWDQLSLDKAFEDIQRQTSYYFTFDHRHLQGITISSKNKEITLGYLFGYITKKTGLKFSVLETNIFVSHPKPSNTRGAKIMINVPPPGKQEHAGKAVRSEEPGSITRARVIGGKVTGQNGAPLSGATIQIKGTDLNTITDAQGVFSLAIPEGNYNAILLVSYVGYETKEVVADGQGRMEIQLVPASSAMNEAVVVGYGTQKKINLTGAVTRINSAQIQNRPITQASQALYGITPGVLLNSKTGEAGNDGVDIRIRGVGTLNDANPLILVDGIEAPFNNINPNDIETINILKDAASAAIYGARAANGVILITTKRGLYEKRQTVEYSAYAGVSDPTFLPKLVTDPRTYLELFREASINSGTAHNITDADLDRYSKTKGTDWIDVVFRKHAPITQHNLSLSGGSASIAYNMSLGYLSQQGMVGGDQHYDRYNARLNVDAKINKQIKLGTSLSYIYGNATQAPKERVTDLSGKGTLTFELAATQHPVTPVYDSLGRYAAPEAKLGLFSRENAQALMDRNRPVSKTNDFLGNFYIEVTPLKGLSLRGTVAANYRNEQFTQIMKEYQQLDWVTGLVQRVTNRDNSIIEMRRNALNFTTWLQATYDVKVGDMNLRFLGGVNQESAETNNLRVDQTGFGTSTLVRLGDGTLTSNAATSPGEWALRSYFGRAGLDWAGKYLFEANLRRDGSSRFGRNNRWATFPSFSAGYILSREDFWHSLRDVINLFKIRASWGKLGNQNTSLYPFASSFSLSSGYLFNDALVPGGAVTRMGNPDLKWEETTLSNIGINLELLHGRLAIEADAFVRKTEDILTPIANPLVMGVSAPTIINAASVDNKGWELALNYHDKIGAFNFQLGGNLSNIKNKVTAINPALSANEDMAGSALLGIESFNQIVLMRGQPIGSLYGYIYDGIFQTQAEIDQAPDHSFIGKPRPGDMRYRDWNGDKKITPEDQTIIGNTQPEWVYGFNLGANFKGIIDISALFQGVGRSDRWLARMTGPFPFGGLRQIWTNRWTPENPSPDRPRLWVDRSGFNGQSAQTNPTSFWVENAAYLRLKNIQVGFNIPGRWLNRAKLQKARFYLNAQNLVTWTDFAQGDFDPERTAEERHVTGSLPHAKVLTAGVNITF